MEARRGQRLDGADRQQVADRVPRQAAPADLIPIDIKTRAWPSRELFEIEIERWCEQALVNRQLPYAASGIGERFRDVSDAEFDASVLQLLAHAAPVAGEPLPLENSILCHGGFAEGYEYGGNDHEHGTAGSQKNVPAVRVRPRLATPASVPLAGDRGLEAMTKTLGLSRRRSWALPAVDRAIGTLRAEQVLGDTGDCFGEIGIVRAALDDRLLLDEGLIRPVQIEPRLDRDRPVYAEGPVSQVRACEAANFASGMRAQFEAPLDSVGRGGIVCRRLETPVGEVGVCHVHSQIARQVSQMKPRQRIDGGDLQRRRCRDG